MTLYLKYRPQKISELDLKAVRESLEMALKKEEVPHAWLFAGPRGTGKTSAARILAKNLNCEKGGCGKCEICREVADGSYPDVVEIDAASNRGIDEIRTLREQVALAPMRGRYKVYIIDEVHMLTTEAANALLKTLEEPPAHVVFVLCTTEMEKLPETVVSRCRVVRFKRPSIEEIVGRLERVVKQEQENIGKEELEKIAKAARGSFRDAIKILEQAIANGGDVKGTLGMAEGVEPEDFLRLVREGKTREAAEFVSEVVKKGVNLRDFVERCVEVLREELLETMDRNLIGLIEGLEKAYGRMKDAAVVQLPLEIFVIENTKISSSKPQEPKVEKKDTGNFRLEDVTGRWNDVMKAVRPLNHSVEALLRSTRPVGFDGRDLVLEAFYEFHKKQLETDRCRMIVEKAVGEVFGVGQVVVKMKLGNGQVQVKTEDESEKLVKAAEEIFK